MTTLSCPRCQASLAGAGSGKLATHGCASCGGVFVDLQQTNRIHKVIKGDTWSAVDALARGADGTTDRAPAVACPHCGQQMTRRKHKASGIEIDVCDRHGTWFDAGELRMVAHAEDMTRATAKQRQGPSAGGGARASRASSSGDRGTDVAGDAADTAVEAVGVGVAVGVFEVFFEGLFGMLGD